MKHIVKLDPRSDSFFNDVLEADNQCVGYGFYIRKIFAQDWCRFIVEHYHPNQRDSSTYLKILELIDTRPIGLLVALCYWYTPEQLCNAILGEFGLEITNAD